MKAKNQPSFQLAEPKGRSVTEMRADWMDANNMEFDLRTKQYRKIKI